MKIMLILTFVFSLILDQYSFANANKYKSKETIYNNLLSRFECTFGPNINNPKWICNEDAPLGWGDYYGKKLKNLKKEKRKYANK